MTTPPANTRAHTARRRRARDLTGAGMTAAGTITALASAWSMSPGWGVVLTGLLLAAAGLIVGMG